MSTKISNENDVDDLKKITHFKYVRKNMFEFFIDIYKYAI